MENATPHIPHDAALAVGDTALENAVPAVAPKEKLDKGILAGIFLSAAAIALTTVAIARTEFKKQNEAGTPPAPRKLSYSPISYLPQ